jgi:hypothetical protein
MMNRSCLTGCQLACGLLLALALGGCASQGGGAVVTECAYGIDSYGGNPCVSSVIGGADNGQILVPPYVLGNAGMWVNPQYNGAKFQRVVVIAGGLDPNTRRAVEEAFASQLTGVSKVEARPSYSLYPDVTNMSRDDAMASLVKAGADGAIVILVTHQDSDLLYAPTIGQSALNMMTPESTQRMTQIAPTITNATVQSQLIRLADPAVICVGKVHGPGLTAATAANAANVSINAMYNWGVF